MQFPTLSSVCRLTKIAVIFIIAGVPLANSKAAAPVVAVAKASASAQVVELMERVADWQLAHPTGYPSDDWTEGVGNIGMLALADLSKQDRYAAAVRKVGEDNEWRLGPSLYHADDHIIGQAYAELFMRVRDPRMLAPMRAQFDYILAHPRTGSLNWKIPGVQHRWSWCDALFMGPPTWARLSAATGDPRYLNFAITNWWLTSDYLYDRQEHLFYRDARFFDRREANGHKIFWSRGNGWVMGGLVRMLQYIPEQHPERSRFVRQYLEMAERIRELQQADGLWRVSLLDPVNYPNEETSGSALYTYSLAWGVNHGLLSEARFAPVVGKAWQALTARVNKAGKLEHVQPIGEDPRSFAPNSTDVFAVGAFLLAGSEVYRGAEAYHLR